MYTEYAFFTDISFYGLPSANNYFTQKGVTMFCSVYSAAICGVEPQMVSVEIDISGGLPSFNMVGLPSSEVREAKERVLRAIENSGYEIPARKITINLSPANLKKTGSGFDLPIAVAFLSAIGVINPESIEGMMLLGELSLDGSILPVNGILPVAVFAAEQKVKKLVIPEGNAFEGAYVPGIDIYSSRSLSLLVKDLKAKSLPKIEKADLQMLLEQQYLESALDYRDVKGQEAAKRATMVAAAGFHNLLYVGPPGSGKSLMAQRIPSIINQLSPAECLEVSKIYSAAGLLKDESLITQRPFRAPHHSITSVALIGGTQSARCGEVSLAHKGILFLDEAAEFRKDTIETLRQPMEDKQIVINRASYRAVFPADFMLVMAMNPCKCGYFPDRSICNCTEQEVKKYFGKIKGPVLDRIDIHVAVEKVAIDDLKDKTRTMSSAEMRESVHFAHEVQKERFKDETIDFNSQMTNAMIKRYCELETDAREILNLAYDKYHLSARGYYKIIKVARTIADMEQSRLIERKHILEAIGYRNSLLEM